MGPTKKEKSEVAHVVMTLIKLDKNNPLQKALEHAGVSTPDAVLSLSPDDIDDLHCVDDKSNKIDMFRWVKSCICILQQCNHLHWRKDDPIKDWMTVTQDEITEFRISPDCDPSKTASISMIQECSS